MKRISIFIAIAALFGTSACAGKEEPKEYHIPSGPINVRGGPGTNHPRVFQLQTGDAIQELKRQANKVKVGKWQGYWVNIRHKDREGWILSTFMKPGRPAAGKSATGAKPAPPAKTESGWPAKLLGAWYDPRIADGTLYVFTTKGGLDFDQCASEDSVKVLNRTGDASDLRVTRMKNYPKKEEVWTFALSGNSLKFKNGDGNTVKLKRVTRTYLGKLKDKRMAADCGNVPDDPAGNAEYFLKGIAN